MDNQSDNYIFWSVMAIGLIGWPCFYLIAILIKQDSRVVKLTKDSLVVPLGIFVFKTREISYGDITVIKLKQNLLDRLLGMSSVRIEHQTKDQRAGFGGDKVSNFYSYTSNWYLIQGLELESSQSLIKELQRLKFAHQGHLGVNSNTLIANPAQQTESIDLANLLKLGLGLIVGVPLMISIIWSAYLYYNGENVLRFWQDFYTRIPNITKIFK